MAVKLQLFFFSMSEVSHYGFISPDGWDIISVVRWIDSVSFWLRFFRGVFNPQVFHKDPLFTHIPYCQVITTKRCYIQTPKHWGKKDFLGKRAYSLFSWWCFSLGSLYVWIEGSGELSTGFHHNEHSELSTQTQPVCLVNWQLWRWRP